MLEVKEELELQLIAHCYTLPVTVGIKHQADLLESDVSLLVSLET